MAQQPATRIDAHFIAAGKYHDIDYPRLEILKLLAEHPHISPTGCAFATSAGARGCPG